MCWCWHIGAVSNNAECSDEIASSLLNDVARFKTLSSQLWYQHSVANSLLRINTLLCRNKGSDCVRCVKFDTKHDVIIYMYPSVAYTHQLTLLAPETEYSGSGGQYHACCMLLHWFVKLPEHQQAWYWLYRTDNMYCCFRVNFIYLGQANSKILFKILI